MPNMPLLVLTLPTGRQEMNVLARKPGCLACSDIWRMFVEWMYNLQAPFSIRKRVDAYTSTSICLTSHRLACPQTHTVRGKCSARSKSVPVWLCGKFCRHTSWSRSPLLAAPPGALQTEKGMLKIILTMTAKSAGVWEARCSKHS